MKPKPRRRKAVNITLSDRSRAIAELLAEQDGTSVSQVLDGMLLVELSRGGRVSEAKIAEMIAALRARRSKGAQKTK